jgi:phosphotransacetylase
MKNYSDTICNKQNRTLTAKAYKFQTKVIEIVAKKNGITRYHSEFKFTREKLNMLFQDLFIDKELTILEVKEIIQNSICVDLKKLI